VSGATTRPHTDNVVAGVKAEAVVLASALGQSLSESWNDLVLVVSVTSVASASVSAVVLSPVTVPPVAVVVVAVLVVAVVVVAVVGVMVSEVAVEVSRRHTWAVRVLAANGALAAVAPAEVAFGG
jgi:hypothetical protein